VGAQSDEGHANRTAFCWSGMTDTEHATSHSIEEEQNFKSNRVE